MWHGRIGPVVLVSLVVVLPGGTRNAQAPAGHPGLATGSDDGRRHGR